MYMFLILKDVSLMFSRNSVSQVRYKFYGVFYIVSICEKYIMFSI